MPPDHPSLAERLNNLGNSLDDRFERQGEMKDLKEAIDIERQAVAATPSDHPNLALFLVNLGSSLGDRFQRQGEMKDLEEAIDIERQAVAATPPDHPNLALFLAKLGNSLRDRFQRQGEMKDLEEAIDIGRQAVAATPPDHPDLAGWLNNLGGSLRDRFQRQGEMNDLEEAISLHQKTLYHKSGQPLFRIRSGRTAANHLVFLKRWQDAAKNLEEAINLLPMVTIRSHSREDLQYTLQSLSGLASFTASVFLKAGKPSTQALDILERGRGIIASLTIDLRSDESKLQKEYSELWSQYTSLRQEIAVATLSDSSIENDSNSPTIAQITRAGRSSQRLELFKELENIETEIRKQPGFQRFHLAPTEEEILQLAYYGPLVIFNTSDVSSEAFIITIDSIQHIGLPELNISSGKGQDLKNWLDLLIIQGNTDRRDATLIDDQQNKSSRSGDKDILATKLQLLGDTAVNPVLDTLGFLKETEIQGELPHIWWVGGGFMSLLSLHAAGEHSPQSAENTMSHVISSYSPSLKSLQFVRSKPRMPLNQQDSKILVVSMPTTPGLGYDGNLNVADEVTSIKQQFTTTESVTALERPTKEDVLKSFNNCNVAHFACHGRADRVEPANSALLLGNENLEELTITDLDAINHDHAQIAYLSACSTAETKVSNLVDESIHLASTFQLVGFPHVIGTLWGADDSAAVEVAGEFYRLLLQNTKEGRMSVSRALHDAVLRLKNMESNSMNISKWAPFIHIGS